MDDIGISTQYSKSFRTGVRGTTLLQKGFPRKYYLSESNLVVRRAKPGISCRVKVPVG